MKTDIFRQKDSIIRNIVRICLQMSRSADKMQKRWIFFDLGNTLYDESAADAERVKRLLASNRYPVTEADFTAQMRCGAANFAPSPFTYAREQFGIAESVPYDPNKEILFAGTAQMLEKLAAEYRLGILANQPADTRRRLLRDGILRFFQICLLSDAEGYAKPDPAFFAFACQKADCPPQEIIMIGDRLENDIAPAQQTGMQTVWMRQGMHAVQEPQKIAVFPDHTVHSVQELCGLLE